MRVLYAISLLYQRKVVVEKTNFSMLLIFSIKEKVSKENGKKFVMNLNGLTSENLTNSK
ncbi:MAG: hypothetical protein WCI91_02790 [Candidatus Nomurabacteria bacterium]